MISLSTIVSVVCLPVLLAGAVTVDTEYGPVEGRTFSLHTGNEVNSFLAIPFAKPPLGELRWMPPENPEPWIETLDATELGTVCNQRLASDLIFTHPDWDDFGEDCLHLSIYTPTDMSGAPYPVMVWLHGGAHQTGSSISYPGYFLADNDVVVVVPNYRLGIIGYGTTKDEMAPGNYGMLDQVLALQFVQENIANFGGDPDQVTIFGESAGAVNVGLMLFSPLATGLFHRAIFQSGNEFAPWGLSSPEDDQNYMLQVAERVDCPVEDPEEMMDCLREVPPRRLIAANITCTPGYFCEFTPVVDGYYLTDTPHNLRESGNYHKVPEMMGINSEDSFIFQPLRTWNGTSREVFEEVFRDAVTALLPRWPDPDREEDVYQAALYMYTPWPNTQDENLNREQVGRRKTDFDFGSTADEQAKLHSGDDNDVFYYVYNHRASGTSVPEWMGCAHGAEIPFTFGHPLLQFNPEVRNATGFTASTTYDETDVNVANYMMTMWTNFAKFGTPTPDPLPPDHIEGADAITWPLFTPDDLTYLWIGTDVVESRSNYRQEYYAFVQHYLHWLAYGTEMP